MVVEPQRSIYAGGARYRADFMVYLVRPDEIPRRRWASLVVEAALCADHLRAVAEALGFKELWTE